MGEKVVQTIRIKKIFIKANHHAFFIYRGDDAGDNEVISDHASGDDNDDMDDY